MAYGRRRLAKSSRKRTSTNLRGGRKSKRSVSFVGELARAAAGTNGVAGAIGAAVGAAIERTIPKNTYGGEAVIRKANKVFIGKKRRFTGVAKVKRLLNPPFHVHDQVDVTNQKNADVLDWRLRPAPSTESLETVAGPDGINISNNPDLWYQLALTNDDGKQNFSDQIFFSKQWVYKAYNCMQRNKTSSMESGAVDTGNYVSDGYRSSCYLEKLWLKRTFLNTSNAVAKIDVYVLQPTQHWNMLDLRDRQAVANGATPLFYYNDFCEWPERTMQLCYEQTREVNGNFSIVPGTNSVLYSGLPDAVENKYAGDYLSPHIDPLRGPWSKVFKKYFKVVKHNYFSLAAGEQKDFKLTQHLNKLVDATTFVTDQFDRTLGTGSTGQLSPNGTQLFNYPGVTKFLMVRLRSQMAFNAAQNANGLTMARATIQWVDNFGMSLRPVPIAPASNFNFADMTLPEFNILGIVNTGDLGEVPNQDYDI